MKRDTSLTILSLVTAAAVAFCSLTPAGAVSAAGVELSEDTAQGALTEWLSSDSDEDSDSSYLTKETPESYITVEINSMEDFRELVENCHVDSWSLDKSVVLNVDLDFSGEEFEPIAIFSGIFDGQGHTLSGVTITGSVEDTGVFGIIENTGIISDLNIEGTYTPSGYPETIGGIAGINYGIISGCTFSGDITADAETGGIVGRNKQAGIVMNCSSSGTITASSGCGGIAGYNEGTISFCENGMEVNTTYQDTTPSLDELDDALDDILQSESLLNTGSLSSDSDIGGIAGFSSGVILSCTNRGAVGYEHVGYNVGGIAGRSTGFLSDNTNYGTIYGRKDVGGIVGQMQPYLAVSFTEETLNDLETELDKLTDLIENAIDDADYYGNAVSNHLTNLTGLAEIAEDAVAGLADETADTIDDVADDLNAAGDRISTALDIFAALGDEFDDYMDGVGSALSGLGDLDLSDIFGSTSSSIEALLDDIASLISELRTSSETAADGAMDQLQDLIEQLNEKIKNANSSSEEETSGNEEDTTDNSAGSDAGLDSEAAVSSDNTQEDVSEDNGGSTDDSSEDSGSMTGSSENSTGSDSETPSENDSDGNTARDGSESTVGETSSDTNLSESSAAADTQDSMDSNGEAASDESAEETETSAESGLSAASLDLTLYTESSSAVSNSGRNGGGDDDLSTADLMVISAEASNSSVAEENEAEEEVTTAGDNTADDNTVDDNTVDDNTVDDNTVDDNTVENKYSSWKEDAYEYISELQDILSGFEETAANFSLASPDLSDLTDSIDAAADALSDTGDLTYSLSTAMSVLSSIDLQISGVSDTMRADGDILYESISQLTGEMEELNQEINSMGNTASGDLEAIVEQFNVVTDTLIDTVESLTDSGDEDEDAVEDTSEEDIESTTRGRTTGSVNYGSVEADINVGGIVGVIGVEYSLDPELDIEVSGSAALDYIFQAKCIVDNSINYGTLTTRSNYAGGIAGNMEMGLVTNCENYGTLDCEGKYIGGIAGYSAGTVRSSTAKCEISGSQYVGGIAGYGTTLRGNLSMVNLDEDAQNTGAIAGAVNSIDVSAISENYYYSTDSYGIGSVSYTGIAEGVSYEELLAMDSLPDSFLDLTLSFYAEDTLVGVITCAYGDSINTDDLPEIPEKEGFYGVWSRTDYTEILSDESIEAEYIRYNTLLTSEQTRTGGLPAIEITGQFRKEDSLTVTAAQTEGDEIERWTIVIPDDGQEVHELRFLIPDDVIGGTLYLVENGERTKVSTETYGEYLTVEVTGNEVVLALEDTMTDSVQGKIKMALLIAVIAAAIILLILLIRRKLRRARKAR